MELILELLKTFFDSVETMRSGDTLSDLDKRNKNVLAHRWLPACRLGEEGTASVTPGCSIVAGEGALATVIYTHPCTHA
jgi:hypothetical protein